MRVLLLSSVLMLACAPAYATDEFGARFGGNTPVALQDEVTDPAAEGLQGLEPAAGSGRSAAGERNRNGCCARGNRAQVGLRE